MPPKTTTRATTRTQDAGPSRTTRSTRVTATVKRAEVEVVSEDEILAKEMTRVLKVSEPEPQAKSKTVRQPTAVKAKIPITKTRPAAVIPAKTASAGKTVARTSRQDEGKMTNEVAPKQEDTPVRSKAPVPARTVRPLVKPSAAVKPPIQASKPAIIPRPPAIVSATASARPASTLASTTSRSISTADRTNMTATRAPVALSSKIPSTAATPQRNMKIGQSSNAESRSAGISRAPITRPTVSLKGKETEQIVHDLSKADHPWTDPNMVMTDTARAQAAMSAVKASLATLTLPTKANYLYGSVGSGWTTERIDMEMAVCDHGLRILREMDRQGKIGGKGIEVEKAGQAIIAKAMNLGMWRRAFDQLVEARDNVARLYDPTSCSPPSIAEPVPSAHTRRIPKEWLSTFWLPRSMDDAESDVTRGICMQYLIGAWSSLIAIEGYGFDLPPFNELMPSASQANSEWMNPLRLAARLPWTSCTSALSFFSRRLSHIPMIAPHWPHIFLVIIQALLASTTTVTVPGESSTTAPGPVPRRPSAVWETMQKWILAYLKRTDIADDQSKTACRIITEAITWADEVIAIRQDDRGDWYKGQAWRELLETWTDLARKTRDVIALDRALAASAVSITLANGPTSKGMPSVDTQKSSEISVSEPEHALEMLSTLFTQFGAVEAALSGPASSISTTQVIDALDRTSWDDFAPSLAGLKNDKSGHDAFARAYRTSERARRLVGAALRRGKGTELFEASHEWISKAADAIGSAIMHITIGDVPDHDALVISCISCISSRLYYQANDVNETEIIPHLDRGRVIACLVQDPNTSADCLRSLAETAYSAAYGLHSHTRYETGARVIQRSIDLTTLALDTLADKSRLKTSQSWKDCVTKRAAKYDILSACLLSSDRREDAIRVASEALRVHDPSIYPKLVAGSQHSHSQATSVDFPRLETSINRFASYLTSDLEPLGPGIAAARIEVVLSPSDSFSLPDEVLVSLMERLFESLLQRASKQDGQETTFILGEKLIGLLKSDESALRRIRVISRLLSITASHGVGLNHFDSLVSQAEACLDVLRSDQSADSVIAFEYQAVIQMIKAFHAYQNNDDPSHQVLSFAEQAILELRQLLVPPSRSRESTASRDSKPSVNGSSTVRGPSKKTITTTPARKIARSASESAKVATSSSKAEGASPNRRSSGITVTKFDDVTRLSTLLTSMISLLGLLGHTLTKVNALKVLRALLRHREESLSDYVSHSAELASLYWRLGKYTRAENVFKQALRTAHDHPGSVTPAVQSEARLRRCEHLASLGQIDAAITEYGEAERHHSLIEIAIHNNYRDRVLHRCGEMARLSLAHRALASIKLAQDNAASAINHTKIIVGLRSRIVTNLAGLAIQRSSTDDPVSKESKGNDATVSDERDTSKATDANPFIVAPLPSDKTGANEPSKDEQAAAKKHVHPLANRYLHGVHWDAAHDVLDAYLDLAGIYAQRGSAIDARYYLRYAQTTALAVKSSAISARTATKMANLSNRLNQLEQAQEKITLASTSLAQTTGPDASNLQIARGDLLARQHLDVEAVELLDAANNGIHGLDTQFVAADALLPTPKKDNAKKLSLSSSTKRSPKEPLLPSTLSQVLRQQAWLFREAGQIAESDELYRQVGLLQSSGETRAEESYLHGKIALDNAFNVFKTDLFMSSLTESTLAMPMGTPGKKLDNRQSARHRIQVILNQADEAYRSALSMVAGSGRVEDVRQACLSLALLRAFQTSLGQGSMDVTAFAADILATSTSVTLHREILEAVEGKFYEYKLNDVDWPKLDAGSDTSPQPESEDLEDVLNDRPLQAYWRSVQSRYLSNSHLSPDKSAYDLSSLPTNWAVVSISVTEDRNTMLISRHQNGRDPLVFCLPLDRQGKRDGGEDTLTFDDGMNRLKEIVRASDECSQSSKSMTTSKQKDTWWETKRSLDKALQELIERAEFCWLGAFKTIFSPKSAMTPQRLAMFRTKCEKVFNLALFGSAHESKRMGKVHLNDSLLACFATLSSKSQEEEIEDFIYFILDVYQFHGVPVAIEELDLDQIGVDLVTALTEMEATHHTVEIGPEGPEHLFLALDKNTHAFPWESIPCLRGRPVSRIPSLPVLLDQVALIQVQQPGSIRRTVNSKKTYFILNPSGDLKVTQTTFEPMLKQMEEHSGWKGIIGDKPSELEMSRILRDYDLVLYFGHGGAEQYIPGSKVRTLPKCATTFLWGCSSGKLHDQGDLDAAGTAWNYIMAGCPALTATLWDVTDRDIDRITNSVFTRLGLSPTQMMQQEKPRAEHSDIGLLPPSGQGMGLSTVEAVNQARESCKMTYLTGAAVVHYGIPVYIY